MSTVKLTRDHHLLTRNLKLNSNYISNDGGDEGISITDAGAVTMSDSLTVTKSSGPQLTLGYDADEKLTFNVADNGVTTIATTDNNLANKNADLTLDIDGEISLESAEGIIEFHGSSAILGAFDNDGDFTVQGDVITSGAMQAKGTGGLILGTAGNTDAVSMSMIVNTGTNAGKDLIIAAGSTTTGGNNIDGGDLVLKSGGGDGTGTSFMQFLTKVSGTDAVAERMRVHTNGYVGIGVADPDTTLEVVGNSKVSYSGTTTNAFEIITPSLTSGKAVFIDINDSLTASSTKTLVLIDYDKSGVTGDTQLSSTTAFAIGLKDSATNHADSFVQMVGQSIEIDSDNAQGTITQTGLILQVGVDGVGDAAGTTGIATRVMDGGTDILMQSSVDTGDYCSIATTTAGATTITTVDDDGADADLTLDIDGEITLNVGDEASIKFTEEGGMFAEFYDHRLGGGTFKLYQDSLNQDDFLMIQCDLNGVTSISTIDQAGHGADLSIHAAGWLRFQTYNPYGSASDQNETHDATFQLGGAVVIDKGWTRLDAKTLTALEIDFDKTGASESNNWIYGLKIDTTNTTAEGGSNVMYGIHNITTLTHAADSGVALAYGGYFKAIAGTNGAGVAYGLTVVAEGGDVNHGIVIDCEDGGNDLRILSSADSGDFFQIETTTNGASTISTNDDDGSDADLTFTIDGDTIIDRDVTLTTAGTYTGLLIDFAKSGISTSDNVLYGLKVSTANTTATDGTNIMYGVYSTSTISHDADAGIAQATGGYFKATGGTNGSGAAYGLKVFAQGSDDNTGIQINCDDGGNDLRIRSSADTGDYFQIQTNALGATIISTVDDGDSGDGVSANLTLQIDGDITLNSATGVFEMHGTGATSKFADMYAGMILGYTALGIDATPDTYTTTTAFQVIDSTAKVTFVAPPSGNVEIFVSVYVDTAIGRVLCFGLSDNASYNTLDVTHEHSVYRGDETDEEEVNHHWVITGLTAGGSYEYWFGASSTPSAGAYVLRWGGDSTIEWQPFVMKAIALPATIYTG